MQGKFMNFTFPGFIKPEAILNLKMKSGLVWFILFGLLIVHQLKAATNPDSLKVKKLVLSEIRLQFKRMGEPANWLSHQSIGLGGSLKGRRLEYWLNAELPLKTDLLGKPTPFTSADYWAGERLFEGEKVTIKRYLFELRLRTRPREKSPGFQLGINYYWLDVTYENRLAFQDQSAQSDLDIFTIGPGVFYYRRLTQGPFSLLWLELNALAAPKDQTLMLLIHPKLHTTTGLNLGLILETLQPHPRFANFYLGTYLEYAYRW